MTQELRECVSGCGTNGLRICGTGNVRHECRGNGLEEQSNAGGHAGDVATESAAERQEAGQESNGGEEESEQVEDEHEPGHVEVVVRSASG